MNTKKYYNCRFFFILIATILSSINFDNPNNNNSLFFWRGAKIKRERKINENWEKKQN